MRFKIIIFFFLLVILNYQSIAQNKKFEVFNALLYKNVPDLKRYGFKDIFLLYEDSLLNSGVPNLEKIKRAASNSRSNSKIPVCLDVESWGLDDASREISMQKYLDLLKVFKRYNENSKVGYFGVFPMDSPHSYYNYENDIRDSIIMPKWHESNNYVKGIGREVTIFFPVFYTRTKDREVWKKIVREKVAKIKEINNKAKVYGFLWPQYYFEHNFPYIDPEVWAEQLDTVYQYCDGAVIWSHYLGDRGQVETFSREMPWFKETLKFMKKYKIKG